MTPATIIRNAQADGVRLALSPAGTIKATGDRAAVNRWLATIRDRKAEIAKALKVGEDADALTATVLPSFFAFCPPGDPEAVEERAAIIAEGCGLDPAQALQEARWHAEREGAWRAFIANARRILDAAPGARATLLTRYRAEAASRYGSPVAGYMEATMRRWVEAREGEREQV